MLDVFETNNLCIMSYDILQQSLSPYGMAQTFIHMTVYEGGHDSVEKHRNQPVFTCVVIVVSDVFDLCIFIFHLVLPG